MAKKQVKKKQEKKDIEKKKKEITLTEEEKKLPKESQEKLIKIKKELEQFKEEVLKKFDKYITGIALLPPPKPEQGKQVDKDKINVLVLVDDSDSQKMSKEELRSKLGAIIEKIGKDINKNIVTQTIIHTELWQTCYDTKHELLQTIALGAPIYDTGMLSAVKIGEIHKSMVLKKFEKYIVSYVLFGSLTRGEATPESDIDVAIIIDDTDVKKMTRAELKDKLRAIIIGMGVEAGEMTGIRNKLNIQVYILTDFWDSLKEANPVIFTVLRDGVPFYDRGIFMPWKQLLRMGKIKPSAEAIDMVMHTGEQMVSRVKAKIKGLIEADIYWATLTPTQAALMLYGIPPPTPNETINLLEDIFCKKEKLLEKEYVDIMKEIRKYYKELEHNSKMEISGKEVDDLLAKSEKYLKRIKKLFEEIEVMKEKEEMVNTYESVVPIIRDILRLEGIERVKNAEIIKLFETEMIHLGKMPEKYIRILNHIVKAKKDYDTGKLNKAEINKVRTESRGFIKFMVEYMQRKRGKELERTKIRVKHGDKYGEVILLDKVAFIVHDLDAEERNVTKADIKADGSLGPTNDSSLEELEQHLAKIELPPKVFIKEPIFENLKGVFGKDVEILMNY